MDAIGNQTLADIVTSHPRTAAVFEKHSLDFCCRGKTTLKEACSEKGLRCEDVEAEIRTAIEQRNTEQGTPDVLSLDAKSLVKYIVETHHRYVRDTLRVIHAHTQKIADVHGSRHPELLEIADCFTRVVGEMEPHMMAEEQILFPYIERLSAARQQRQPVPPAPFGTVQNPIHMMEAQHETAGGLLARIRLISNDYQVPEDACTTYRVTYKELREFEEDLHRHVHLENNILFPRAVALEQGTTGIF
jgi:regulator of cell morphogenesis and NO signaling